MSGRGLDLGLLVALAALDEAQFEKAKMRLTHAVREATSTPVEVKLDGKPLDAGRRVAQAQRRVNALPDYGRRVNGTPFPDTQDGLTARATLAAERAGRAVRALRAADSLGDAGEPVEHVLAFAKALLLRAVGLCDAPPVTVGPVTGAVDDGDRDAGADVKVDVVTVGVDEVQPAGLIRLSREGAEHLLAGGVVQLVFLGAVVQDESHGLAPSRDGEGSVGPVSGRGSASSPETGQGGAA